MNEENAIEVKHLKKTFKVYFDKSNQLKERVIFWKRNRYEKRQVLNDISFNVKKGEAIGLIGHNGCGKSTTLKLLTRIMYPDSGTVEMKGRVSALIELGAGFHPDMSGRENIYTNAAIFGLSKAEIDERIDDIIAFSELQEFIDNPVRTYSSGMYMRLAFAVAINVNADILLIDEILAVGDAAFQAKCFNKIREIKAKGTTIVIVSHSLSQIEQICERSIWIQDGVIKEEGKPTDVHVHYMEYMSHKSEQSVNVEKKEEVEVKENKQDENTGDAVKTGEEEKKVEPEKILTIDKLSLFNEQNVETLNFSTGQKAVLKIDYTCDIGKIDEEILVGIIFRRNDGVISYGTNTRNERISGIKLKSEGSIYFEMEKLNLISGTYSIDVAVRKQDMFAYDYCSNGVTFNVLSVCNEIGIAKLEHKWIF